MFMAMGASVGMLIPIGMLLYVWIATMWQGANRLRAPMLFALLAIIAMVFGLAGQLATAVIPVGWQLEHTVAAQQDTIVTLVGASVLAGFAAIHYWMPKITGKYAGEGIAKAAMGLIFVGLVLYGWAMFFAGLKGQPVDVYRFYEDTGLDGFNLVASVGAFILVFGILRRARQPRLLLCQRPARAARPLGRLDARVVRPLASRRPQLRRRARRPRSGAAARHPRRDPRPRGRLRTAAAPLRCRPRLNPNASWSPSRRAAEEPAAAEPEAESQAPTRPGDRARAGRRPGAGGR